MAKGKRGRVVILWHMHQPPYRSPLSGEVLLPWTLCHALRDYYDMPLLAAETGARVTFNLVPSLVDQVEAYARSQVNDAFLRTALADPATLSREERLFLVENFFAVHHETMVKPHSRYAALAHKLHPRAGAEVVAARFSDGELADLQVWFFLAWAGESLQQHETVRELLSREQGFTAADKLALVDAVTAQLGATIPLYRDLAQQGAIELSTSPAYHPILPLLVATETAREADAGATLPAGRFAFPDDARAQLAGALDSHEAVFGRRCPGLWPSEGAVSDPVIAMAGEAGFRWLAGDERTLLKSLAQAGDTRSREEVLYQPWERHGVRLLFRDAHLSDLLGFTYSRWDIDAAVDHFVAQLTRIIDGAPQESPVVTIAMDGENAWEYYTQGGYRFLRRLYERLVAAPNLALCTPSDLLAEEAAPAPLPPVAAGTWIDGSFGTWIGDATKNRAWELLASARTVADAALRQRSLAPREEEELRDLIYRAEASDWFWWFGEGHSSAYDGDFDALFRHHLKAIYRRSGSTPPADLDYPLEGQRETVSRIELPVHRVSPRITGKRDSYYKWLSAGRADQVQGFRHRSRTLVKMVRFGFDDDHLYFKVESRRELRRLMQEERIWFTLAMLRPQEMAFRLWLEPGGKPRVTGLESGEDVADAELAVESVLELALPLAAVGGSGPGTPIECLFFVAHRGREIERFPLTENLVFTLAGEELDEANWHV